MARAGFLLASLVTWCRLLGTASSFQPALLLDMAQILLDNYCFPENLVGMQEAIEQAISSGEILHISDRRTLAAVLSAGVQGALSDPRLVVSYEPGHIPMTPTTLPYHSPEQLMRMLQSLIKAEVIDHSVGYLRVDYIIGEEMGEGVRQFFLDSVLSKVAHTSCLIFDLRYSTSGDMSGIPFIMSYFSDPGMLVHIDSVYDRPSNTTSELWTKPWLTGLRYGKRKDLVVLTSGRTIGVAEGIAYALKHLKRAVVVGERSAGGSVKIKKLRLGKSDFFITVPVARAISPITGQSWEVSGVSPCLSVDAEDALVEAKTLLAVRSAIPKTVQRVSDIIENFYSFTEKVPALIYHLSSMDFFPVFSEEDLAAKLSYELQSVAEDPRLNVRTMQESPVIIEVTRELGQVPEDSSALEALVETLFNVSVLPGNTGYLQFDEFCEGTLLMKLGEQIAKKVWDPLKDTDNLIVDLRFNTRGSTSALPILLSYLHDTSPLVHFFTIYSRIGNTTTEFRTLPGLLGTPYGSKRGVYVLTSHHTAVAGEEFAYLLQSLRRATIIGEITSGTLMHSKFFPVEDTNIVITVPVINFIDCTGEAWLEGGVVPDAIVLAEEAIEQAHKIIAFHQEVQALILVAGDLLEDHYAISEIAIKFKKVLRSKWTEGSYRSVVDYESLASQLTADLQETSGDHRLHIFYCDGEPETIQDVPRIPTAEEAQYLIEALFKVDFLPGNIGHLRVDMMLHTEIVKAIATKLLNLVWNQLVNTDALIIDLRFNTGGFSTAIPLLCTYFFDAEPLRHLYTIFDRSTTTMTEVTTLPEVLGQRYGSKKDVYILTSHITGPAAEVFTRTMKELKRATVIGEPTTGGSLSSGTYQIGGSILYASIPNQVILSAVTGKVWSISGVEPHVLTQAKDALTVAHKSIERTILKQNPGK